MQSQSFVVNYFRAKPNIFIAVDKQHFMDKVITKLKFRHPYHNEPFNHTKSAFILSHLFENLLHCQLQVQFLKGWSQNFLQKTRHHYKMPLTQKRFVNAQIPSTFTFEWTNQR